MSNTQIFRKKKNNIYSVLSFNSGLSFNSFVLGLGKISLVNEISLHQSEYPSNDFNIYHNRESMYLRQVKTMFSNLLLRNQNQWCILSEITYTAW